MKVKYNLLISLFFSFTLCFFGPLELYFSIYEEVWFGINHIFLLIVLLSLTAFAGLFVFLMITNKINGKLHSVVSTLIFSLTLAAYIQGNFLPSHFGDMNGEAVDWGSYQLEMVLSVALWIVVITGCLLLHRFIKADRFQAGIKVVMVCIVLVQIVTLGTLCFTTEGLKSKSSAAFLDKNEYAYSSNENLVVLLLDMYDSQVFQTIYDEEGNEQYFDMLDGFTYYPDTVGAYSLTFCAVPHILTGEKYLNNMDMETYINESYRKSPLLHRLQEEQYDINIYTNEAVPTDKEVYEMISNYLPEENSDVHVSSNRRLLSYLYRLVGIRYLPQPLKRYCWFYSAELWDLREVDYEDNLYFLDNFIFDSGIDTIEINTDRNSFHFYHLEGMHFPCYYDENFERTTENISLEGREGTIRNGKGMLVLVRHFLEKLKELGIYENCAIVIMADHGGRFTGNMEEAGISNANPLLMVKGFGETHSLTISSKAISYDDLQNAFQQLIDGECGEDIFSEVPTGEGRERYFRDASNFVEYYTTGHAFDVDAFKPVQD